MINKKSLTLVLAFLITILSFAFLTNVFLENLEVISATSFEIKDLLYLVFGVVVSIIGHLLLASGWFTYLSGGNEQFKYKDACVVVGLSQLSKYIPGNFAHLLGRVILAEKWFKKSLVAQSLLVESILLVIVSCFLLRRGKKVMK